MANVRPFRGLRYGPSAGPDVAALLAPPYDVIGSQEQNALYQQSPHNVIRVELGQTSPSDSPPDNRYTRALNSLKTWVRERALLDEDAPAFYLIRHSYEHEGHRAARWELLCQVRLAEWAEGVVLPHEFTLPGPKVDRLSLLQATHTNTSQIFSLYRDPAASLDSVIEEVARRAPDLSVPAWRNAAFTLWAVKDEETIQRIQDFFTTTTLYIADGHHRYETALAYRRERREAEPGFDPDAGFNFVFMSLTSMADPGLLVLPIHRVVQGVTDAQVAALQAGIEAMWTVERVPVAAGDRESVAAALQRLAQDAAAVPHFALYGLEPGKLLIVQPNNTETLRAELPPEWSPALRELDLTLLHEVMVHGYLGIGREAAQVGAALGFTHHAEEALEWVDSGAYRLAVLVNPTRVDQLIAVAEVGDKMPQKSTFFYPKLPTGLVMCPLEDDFLG